MKLNDYITVNKHGLVQLSKYCENNGYIARRLSDGETVKIYQEDLQNLCDCGNILDIEYDFEGVKMCQECYYIMVDNAADAQSEWETIKSLSIGELL